MGGLWGLFGREEEQPSNFYGPTNEELGYNPNQYIPPGFDNWYSNYAKQLDLDPNAFSPLHQYDYVSAYQAGAKPELGPDGQYHWPSEYKMEGHPNLVVDGINTKTGKPVDSPSGWSWDQLIPTVSQVGSDIGSSIYDIFAKPTITASEQAQKDMYEALRQEDPLEKALGIAGTIGKGAYNLGSGIVNQAFETVQEPVNRAASYYSDLPQALGENVPSISTLGGGSLRDIAQSQGVENPYLLETIEKGGGEFLEELADPTNIPGALVGAGRLIGKGASNIDKILAGMGTVSGFSGGIPALYKGSQDIINEGVSPEAYGKLLEGTIGAGFGGLSAAGLASGGKVDAPGIVENIFGGSETGAMINPFSPLLREKLDQTQEEIINNLRTEELSPEVLEPIPENIPEEISMSGMNADVNQMGLEASFRESQENALNAKIQELQNLGFGSETIGGLNPNQANEIISAQTPRSEFNPDMTYEDRINEIMRQNGVDENLAMEILSQEGIYPPAGEVPNIVYHGTPYDFNQFDLSKIGTGEGAQAYGHGFYFAENPEVAGDYAEKLGRNRVDYDPNDPIKVAQTYLSMHGDESLDVLNKEINRLGKYDPNRLVPTLKAAANLINEGKIDIPKSQVLASQIPSPEEFLDLDVPLGEQSDRIKNILPEAQKALRYEPNIDKSVHDVQASIPSLEGKVSDFTLDAIKTRLNMHLESGGKIDRNNLEQLQHLLNIAGKELVDNGYRQSLPNALHDLNTELDKSLFAISEKSKPSEILEMSGEETIPLQKQGLKGIKYLDRQSRNLPFNEMKKAFLKEIPQDATIEEFNELPYSHFTKSQREFMASLEKDDWLGFDYPAQAINAALTKPQNYDLSKSTLDAIDVLKKESEGTRNYVVFDPKDIKILAKTKDISRENLQKFVDSVKEKYGKTWKKKLNPQEKAKIAELQRKLPESLEKASPAYKEAYEKGQIPEHYTEKLPKKEEVDKRKEEVKAKIKALGPGPGIIPNVSDLEFAEFELPPDEILNQMAEAIRIEGPRELLKLSGYDPKGKTDVQVNLLLNKIGLDTPEKRSNFAQDIINNQYQNRQDAMADAQELIPNVPPISPAQVMQGKLQQSLASFGQPKVLSAQSLMGTPTKNIPPPSTPKPPTPPKVSKPSGPKVPPLQLKNLGLFERAAFTSERNIAKTSPEISKAEKAYREYHERESSKHIGNFREAIQGMKGSEKRIISKLNGNIVPNLTAKEATVANIINGLVNNVTPGIPPKFNSFSEIETHIDSKVRESAKKQFLSGIKFTSDKSTMGKQTEEYVRNYIKQIQGNVKSGPVAKVASKLRQAVALGNLQLTQILQAGQVVHTTSYVGFRRSIRAAWKALKGYKKEELQAVKDGALWPTMSHEVGAALGSTGYMHGTPTVDKALRVHANIAGKMLLKDAKKGEKYANRILKDLGLTVNSLPAEVGKKVSDKTQFRTDISHLPSWAHTTPGRMVWQYSQFAYAHSKFMYEMIKPMLKGDMSNSGQVFRMALLAATVGEGIADLRTVIRALVPGDKEDDELKRRELEALAGDPKLSDKKLSEKIKAVMRNDRIPFDSPGWRALQNMSMIGGAGIFQSILEKAMNAKGPLDILKLSVGPAATQAAELFGAGIKDIEKEQFREVPKELLKKVPIPFYPGSKIAGKVFPPKSRGGGSKFPSF